METLLGTTNKPEPYKYEDIPMSTKTLLLYEVVAEHASVNWYQHKTSTILYAAVITQLDIAYACSKLTRFNLNPGPEHHKTVDRVINYLLSTRYHTLCVGGSDTFTTYTVSFVRWWSTYQQELPSVYDGDGLVWGCGRLESQQAGYHDNFNHGGRALGTIASYHSILVRIMTAQGARTHFR
jgi:hypothetical protein